MNYIYKASSSIFTDEAGNHTVYGITAYSGDGSILRTVDDIFCDKNEAEQFAKMCTELTLSPYHLDNAIEDALSA